MTNMTKMCKNPYILRQNINEYTLSQKDTACSSKGILLSQDGLSTESQHMLTDGTLANRARSFSVEPWINTLSEREREREREQKNIKQ